MEPAGRVSRVGFGGGRQEDLQGPCHELLEACVQAGDLSGALAVMDKMRARGLHLDSSSLSNFFWTPGEEEEMESAPPHLRKVRPGGKLGGRGTGGRVPPSTGDIQPMDISSAKEASTPGSAPPTPKWQDLPAELLIEALRQVDHRTVVIATGVCRSWRAAIGEATQEISLSWCGRGVTPLLQSIAARFPRLQVLSLRRCPLLTDVAIQSVAASCRQLRALDLSMATRLTDRALLALADGCHAIEMLDLSGCRGVGEAGVRALPAGCPSLRQLNLCGCENAATDSALQAMAQGCPELQSLNVGWCERLTDAGVGALARGCRALEVVDLCGCLLITDASVEALAEGCPGLAALGLHCCRLLTDHSMRALVAARRRHLAASAAESSLVRKEAPSGHGDGSAISSSSAATMTSGALQHGHLTLAALNKRTPRSSAGLVSLNLSGCTGLHAPAVQAVCDAFPALHTCPQRCSLNFSGCLALTSVRCRCISNDDFGRGAMAALRSRAPVNPRNRPL